MIVYRCDCCGRDYYKKELLTEYCIPRIGWKINIYNEATDYLEKSHTEQWCDKCGRELADVIINTMNKIYMREQDGCDMDKENNNESEK